MGMLLQLLKGMTTSILIFTMTLTFTFPLGMVVALGRMSKNKILSTIVQLYISIMRGTPLMLQIIIVYYGPFYVFGMSLRGYPAIVAVIIAFVLNYSAYFAEIYRSGIASIPIGQYEAATVLGYTKRQTFFKIILPQVRKRILPPITNEVITLVKDTSLAQVIAIEEIFSTARQIANAQASIIALLMAGIFYYVFNFIVAGVMAKVEKSMNYYR